MFTPSAVVASIVASTALLGVSISPAHAGPPDMAVHPDPRVQKYLTDNAPAITVLSKKAMSPALPSKERVGALKDLAVISEDAANRVASNLVGDASEDVARAAVDMLDISLVMTGHDDHAAHAESTPWSKYVEAQHEIATKALRAATTDKRDAVRWAAVKPLVRLSDDSAIGIVRSSAVRKEITERQAVNLCAQGTSTAARACIIDYLNEGTVEGKTAAVQVLGAVPATRALVRNKIFLNSKADPVLRAEAADVLGQNDPGFTDYAIAITADPTTPLEVWSRTMRAYASNTDARGKLDFSQRQSLLRAIDNKILTIDSTTQFTATRSLNELRDAIRSGASLR